MGVLFVLVKIDKCAFLKYKHTAFHTRCMEAMGLKPQPHGDQSPTGEVMEFAHMSESFLSIHRLCRDTYTKAQKVCAKYGSDKTQDLIDQMSHYEELRDGHIQHIEISIDGRGQRTIRYRAPIFEGEAPRTEVVVDSFTTITNLLRVIEKRFKTNNHPRFEGGYTNSSAVVAKSEDVLERWLSKKTSSDRTFWVRTQEMENEDIVFVCMTGVDSGKLDGIKYQHKGVGKTMNEAFWNTKEKLIKSEMATQKARKTKLANQRLQKDQTTTP